MVRLIRITGYLLIVAGVIATLATTNRSADSG